MIPLFGQGDFQTTPNMTPQQIERKRALMAALMPRFGSAKYVGEGVGQLATGVAMGMGGRKLDRAEGANETERQSLMDRILGGVSSRPESSGTGFSVLGQAPVAERPMVQDDASRMGGGGKLGGNQQEFIQSMMPHALRVSEATGLDPRLVIAQAAQETGWGRSAPNNNFFGIKSHGREGGATLGTHEYVGGQRVNMPDSFRTYEDMGQSADDYANFLQTNPRYGAMLAAGDLDGQVAALGQSGYATDPNYAQSVGSIARSIQIPEAPQMAAGGGQPATSAGVASAATIRGGVDTSQPFLLGVSGQPGNEVALVRMADGSTQRLPARAEGGNVMIEGLGRSTGIGEPVQMQNQPPQQFAQLGGGQASLSTQSAPAQSGPDLASLYQALSSPLLRPEDRQIITGLIQQRQQEADPMRALQMQKAQLELQQMQNPAVDPFAGTQVINGQLVTMGPDRTPQVLGDFNRPEPGYRTMTPEEVASVPGLDPAKAYQVGPNNEIKAIGGAGVTVNNMPGGDEFAEAFAKGDAAALGTISESGMAAQRNLTRIDQLASILESSPSGFAAAAALAAGEWGINTEGLSELQAAQAMINSLVPEQRQPGSGPMSDADLDLFKQSLPRVINQPGGNAMIVGTMRAIAQYDAQGAQIVQRVRAGEITRAQAFAELQARPDPMAQFRQTVGAMPQGGASGATTPPAGLAEEDLRWLEGN